MFVAHGEEWGEHGECRYGGCDVSGVRVLGLDRRAEASVRTVTRRDVTNAKGRRPNPPEYFRRSSGDELSAARDRIEHVIVLMLENRSYDSMFGFLDHPSIPNLKPEEHPNHLDADGLIDDGDPGGEPVLPSPSATPRLAFDPPHGHLSALAQMNRGPDGPRMNGFVTAYAQKLAGKEHLPIIHWTKIRILLGVLSVLYAAGMYDLARRAVNGSWASWGWFALAAGGAYLVLAAIARLLRVSEIPTIQRKNIRIVTAVLAILLAASVLGWRRWVTDEPRGIGTWVPAIFLLVMGLINVAKDRAKVRARVPERRLRDSSTAVMRCMPPGHIPVLSTLAKRYVTCTRWHSSVPGATWPNRNFAHAATSDESVDIELGFYEDFTIFQLLDEQYPADGSGHRERETWRIYHHDTPEVIAFPALWIADEGRRRWFDASQLVTDIEENQLPMYAFVEPCHTGEMANSQHPGNNEAESAIDFERGEDLIYSIYSALESNPEVFDKTVFVVTYDEHGGLFDHVPPPPTVHPEPDRRARSREFGRRFMAKFVEHKNRPFDFRLLGPRVPTVIISPWVAAGRPDDRVYDHTSIVASVRLLFAPSQLALTMRDEYACDFLHLLTDAPDTTPASFPPTYKPAPDAIGGMGSAFSRTAATSEEEPGTVLLRDPFADQLAKLNFLVRQEIAASPEPRRADVAAPAVALFKQSAAHSRAQQDTSQVEE